MADRRTAADLTDTRRARWPARVGHYLWSGWTGAASVLLLVAAWDALARQLGPLVLPTPTHIADQDDEDLLDLGNVGVWDLTSAFARLLEEIGQQGTMTIEVEKRDVGYYTRRLLERFRERREVSFTEVFDRSEGRYGLIGTLIALLEMMKQGYLRANQEQCFGEIQLAFRGDDSVTADQILAGITAEEVAQREREAAAAALTSDAGQAGDSAAV